MTILELRNVNKYFGGLHALKHIDLSIEEGSIIGLVGDNAAGKSTLVKSITGAVAPDTGRIVFQGSDLRYGDPYSTRQFGIEMIYQHLNLCLQFDVTANIFLGRELRISLKGMQLPFLAHHLMARRAQSVIDRLNAEISVNTMTGVLSGGQQQTVAIARAILFTPKLLIMDEPTAALGVREVLCVLQVIHRLKAEGMTIILISHRLADIFEVADRIVFMRRGEIRADKAIYETTLSEVNEMLIS